MPIIMAPPAEDVFTYRTAFVAHAESSKLTSGPKTCRSVHWTPSFSPSYERTNRFITSALDYSRNDARYRTTPRETLRPFRYLREANSFRMHLFTSNRRGRAPSPPSPGNERVSLMIYVLYGPSIVGWRAMFRIFFRVNDYVSLFVVTSIGVAEDRELGNSGL